MENVEIRMPGTVQVRGASVGITIPSEIAKALGLVPGTALDFRVGEFDDVRGLFIVPIREEPQP